MDNFTAMDCGTESPISDDPFSFNLSALLNLENYPELCSPSAGGQLLSPFSSSPFQQIPSNWSSLAFPSSFSDIDTSGGINPARKTNFQSGISPSSSKMTSLRNSESAFDERITSTSVIPKSMPTISFEERMLRALSLFKQSSGRGILAQVWMPVKHDSGYVLSTSEQPFLLDKTLAEYREVSRAFTFSAALTPGLFPGLPGRVFISGMPEWTSNVLFYNRFEYLRVDYAVNHEVRGSLAVPIFDSKERSCCAVLELVTTKEKTNFDLEMESVCNALQAVDLKTVKPRVQLQNLTNNQKSTFSEILDVLRACCHAHMLPLGLTWVPFSCEGDKVSEVMTDVVLDLRSNLIKRKMLCIQESACYINDPQMKGFLHACKEHCLETGQGIAGKALKSNHPFFSPDVKCYDVCEYPLAHHARKYGLLAAVAIRLRSTCTGNDDYILEFFLPLNCKGSSEQQELLNSLSSTMQRICRSLRTVSDAEIVGAGSINADILTQATTPTPEIYTKHSERLDSDELSNDFSFKNPNITSAEQGSAYHEQFKSDCTGHSEEKRSTTEKNISLSILQQYFSGSLKDAAKSIGVCPTTLKRICRLHGITRWPSRKISKVNRSLKKIQTVINSVQGIEGALTYDPTTGCLVAEVSPTEKSTTMTLNTGNQDVCSTAEIEIERSLRKIELDESSNSKDTSEDLYLVDEKSCKAMKFQGGLSLEIFESNITSKCSGSTGTDDMTNKILVDAIKEHSHPSSSSMTNSSNGSASSCPTLKKCLKSESLLADTGQTITVKATYREDTVRFKFTPSMGCYQLFEEIGTRYKLQIGTFQLKYMDDEEEWVMLASDSDLEECIEVLECMGSPILKVLVRDMPCVVGSSCASN